MWMCVYPSTWLFTEYCYYNMSVLGYPFQMAKYISVKSIQFKQIFNLDFILDHK